MTKKKKIIIFTSLGGGGQISVTQALQAALEPEYEILTYNTFSSTFGPLDPLFVITRGKYSFENLYNDLLRKQYIFLLMKFLYPMGLLWYCRIHRKRATKLITQLFKDEKPDLAISIIPFIDKHIQEACKAQNIPFIVFPPDLDATMYLTPTRIVGRLEQSNFQDWYVTLPFNDPELLRQPSVKTIDKKHLRIIGYPLRAPFFEEKNIATIKKDFELPADKPILLILLGSLGAPTQYLFGAALAEHLKTPAHIVFCIGKNENARAQIESIDFPGQITKTIVGFTDRMADLMAASDLFITKSGTLSVIESIYMNLPLILDATAPIVDWEKENHTFVKSHNFGCSATSYENAAITVNDWFSNPEKLATLRTNLKKFDKKNGCVEMKKLIDEILK